MTNTFAVFIGRFQPVHRGHVQIARDAIKKHGHLIIVIGSCDRPAHYNNPFTYEQRQRLWMAELSQEEQDVTSFVSMRDNFYSDVEWTNELKYGVESMVRGTCHDPKIVLVGYKKDQTSYYLNFFPEWEDGLTTEFHGEYSATPIREFLYEQNMSRLRRSVFGYMSPDMFYGNPALAPLSPNTLIWEEEFQNALGNVAGEWQFDVGYDPSKYPVIVTTVDACVVQNGHVLVIRRKHLPNKGLLAMAGGHLDEGETLQQAMLRELREETSIDLSNRVLTSNIKHVEVFDHPNRSSRARVITHAYLIVLPPSDKLPDVKAGDDASEAFWMPLSKLDITQFHEDHYDIIKKLTAGL